MKDSKILRESCDENKTGNDCTVETQSNGRIVQEKFSKWYGCTKQNLKSFHGVFLGTYSSLVWSVFPKFMRCSKTFKKDWIPLLASTAREKNDCVFSRDGVN